MQQLHFTNFLPLLLFNITLFLKDISNKKRFAFQNYINIEIIHSLEEKIELTTIIFYSQTLCHYILIDIAASIER